MEEDVGDVDSFTCYVLLRKVDISYKVMVLHQMREKGLESNDHDLVNEIDNILKGLQYM